MIMTIYFTLGIFPKTHAVLRTCPEYRWNPRQYAYVHPFSFAFFVPPNTNSAACVVVLSTISLDLGRKWLWRM